MMTCRDVEWCRGRTPTAPLKLGRKIRQFLPTLLYADAAGRKVKKSAPPSVTYVDVDTVATAHGNIVTIAAPPFPSGKGVGGWGPLKTTAAWI